MRILIVEDDQDICVALKANLEAEGFVVDTTDDGEQGSYMARVNDYDLLILDNILPNKQGWQICEDVREAGQHMPIMMLSINSDVMKKVDLLKRGADDYVTKPFSFDELIARIRAILRRPPQMQENILSICDLTLDINRQEVRRNGKVVYLTRKEFGLLEYLLKNKGNVISRSTLMEHVWDVNSDPFSNTVEAHILNLRKKIDRDEKYRIIYTVPGRGYKVDTGR